LSSSVNNGSNKGSDEDSKDSKDSKDSEAVRSARNVILARYYTVNTMITEVFLGQR